MAQGRAENGSSGERSDRSTILSPAEYRELLGLPPDAIPGYTLLRHVGGGAQGQVYLALEHHPRRRVAIKVQLDGGQSELADACRFEREIDALARIDHPNIVTVYSSGTTGKFRYYAMPYISGVTLAEWLERQPPEHGSGSSGRAGFPRRPVGVVLSLFSKICDAVQAAHARGITQRDLKPTNIRVDRDGEPHVLDFGLAKVHSSDELSITTMSGAFIGSVPWASPEQAAGENDRIDARSDVYALGVLLYQALTGEFPYSVRGSSLEVLDRVIHEVPTPLRKIRPDLERDLERIVLRCLSKDRELRYADAGELRADLSQYQIGEPISTGRDSVGHLLWLRGKRALRRRPFEIQLVLQAGVVLAVQLAILALGSSPLDMYYRRAMIAVGGSASKGVPEHVRLIALRDWQSVTRMADRLGISGVSAANRPSLRALHGRLMERLAECGVRVVVWDIDFVPTTQFDQDFVAGVKALAGLDPPVQVIALTPDTGRYFAQPGDGPEICASFAANNVVPAPMYFDEPASWACELICLDPSGRSRAGLQLTAFAAYKAWGESVSTAPDFELDVERKEARIRYYTGEKTAGVFASTGRADVIACTAVSTRAEVPGQLGILQAEIPAPKAFEPEVLEYESVLLGDPAELRAKLRGQAVVIGDARPGTEDWKYHPRLGWIPGCYVVVAGLEALIAQSAFQRASIGLTLTTLAACMAAAALAGWTLSHRPAARVAAIFALTALCLLGSFLAYSEFRIFLNPATSSLACVLSVEGSAWLRRQQPEREPAPARG